MVVDELVEVERERTLGAPGHDLEQLRFRAFQVRTVLPPWIDGDHATSIGCFATWTITGHARIPDRSEHPDLLNRPLDDDVVEEAIGVQVTGHADAAAHRFDPKRSPIARAEDRRAGRREADGVTARLERGEAELWEDPFPKRPPDGQARLLELAGQAGNAWRQFRPFGIGRKILSGVDGIGFGKEYFPDTFVEA